MTDEVLPDRRRPSYEQLEKKIEDNQAANKAELRYYIKRGLIIISGIALLTAVSIFGFGLVLAKQSRVSHDIQQQRYDALYTSCKAQNKRHNSTLYTLDVLTKKALKRYPKEMAKQIEESFASSVLLIDALQPYVADCEAYARTRVNGVGV